MGYRTQDLIFTLYGDYIAPRGSEVWIGHIIELMARFDTSPQAVRSTLSRMTRKGWLNSRREGRHSFYAITLKTEKLLAEGTQRIYQPRQDPWDKRWFVLTYSIPEEQRDLRYRLRKRLIWLGFGRLGSATWISPRDLRQEVAEVAEALGITGQIDLFGGEYFGLSDAKTLVDRCWDLPRLNRAYREFIQRYRPAWRQFALDGDGQIGADIVFTRRFTLVHEYRSFPYVDPNLPPELLPDDWPGNEAIQLFQNYATLLAPKAGQYVNNVLAAAPKE
jgi:phenylacetic acid degradation operon negative regulatory protein